MRNRYLALGMIAAGAMFLAACESGVSVVRYESSTAFSGEVYGNDLAAHGSNAVTVYDSPFPPDRTNAAILNALHERYAGNQYRFFSGDPPPDWNGYTIVLAFADGVLGNSNLCRNPAQPRRPTSAGRTAMFGEVCLGDILVTEVQGYGPPVSGPDDPGLSKLTGAVVAELFAYRTRHANHGNSNPPK